MRKINCTFESFIEPYEIEIAQSSVLHLTQQTFYGREINALKENFKINGKSTILTLCPFLDENDTLRVGGRLNNAELSYAAKHPIIIPLKSHLAKLIVTFSHIILMHSEFLIML